MTIETVSIFDEIAQFLASLSPSKVMGFKTSKKSQDRVNFLLEKNATVGLTIEENKEMEKHMMIEHIVQLAKAKALLKISRK
jgi:hypothetical protein